MCLVKFVYLKLNSTFLTPPYKRKRFALTVGNFLMYGVFLIENVCVTILFVKTSQKIIFWLFGILLFLVAIILWPFTSEVFEFNKMVLVYILTTLITVTWIIRMIGERKFIFRRTILDIPLLVFFGSQFISTLLSIDPSTSWLGYYSRFNGGLFSVICYALLYWAFVSNLDAKRALKLVYIMLISAALVSIYGVLEHFGIDKAIWVQDVQSRVFSTLGQPNWLAAWVVALSPITWAFTLRSGYKSKSFWVYLSLSILLFWTLIFTKSRSGYLGFAAAYFIYWGITAWQNRKELKKLILPFLLVGIGIFTVCAVSGTEWTPSVGSLLNKPTGRQTAAAAPTGDTALETGGTESSVIRKIVWTGAIQVWLHYPVFGTGVETFAYSYYLYRPAAHNLTSEWNFIYNKAHNEYLNYLANSGAVGLLSYLALVGAIIYLFVKEIKSHTLSVALLAGFVSILVTNFFGFSVVPIELQFFLFPAMIVVLAKYDEEKAKNNKESLNCTQKTFIFLVSTFAFYILFIICRYWYADTLFATGKAYNSSSVNRPDIATKYLSEAINLEPNQPVYYGDASGIAISYANLALAFNQQKETDQVSQYSTLALNEIDKAISLSPANVNYKRVKFGILVILATINQNYLLDARDILVTAITQAPTDAKLFYNLGLVYARTGQPDLAIATLQKTVQLKADYKDARLALAYLLIGEKRNTEAHVQLNYILTNIDPTDSLSKQALESIK